MKIFGVVVLALMASIIVCEDMELPQASNGTESYFLSPHSLGKTPEVINALNAMVGQLAIANTTYNTTDLTYLIYNVTLGLAYNDGKQTINISSRGEVEVAGGKVELTYRFNFSKTHLGKLVNTGFAHGSVFSDPLSYKKDLYFNQGGYLGWMLVKTGYPNLTIGNNTMKLKRVDPYDEADLNVLLEMLDHPARAITPASVASQFLTPFNIKFPMALNNTLNHETFGEKIPYSFGDMKMNITHVLYDFDIDPLDGYKVVFVTEIEGYDEPICNITVPVKPYSFENFGGSQNFHLNCLYESVAFYLQSQGYLDTKLGEAWETNSFQFYAGDLYDLINNLHLTVNARSILDGQCKAQKQGLKLLSTREFETNSYALDVKYNCGIFTSNTQQVTVQVAKFTANIKFYFSAAAGTHSLTFKMINAEVMNMSFDPVDPYYVTNTPLAIFKATQMLKLLRNTNVFGTGFPTIVRHLPQTKVEKDWVIYYDTSHFQTGHSLKIQ